MGDKNKSDIVAAIMGKMLLKGYRMLAISCELCNSVIMQDKEGRNICVNCSQDVPLAIGSGGDENPDNNKPGSQSKMQDGPRPQYSPIEKSSRQATNEEVDHENKIGTIQRKIELIQRKIELTLLSEMERTSSTMYSTNLRSRQENETFLSHIRDCALTITTLRNTFTK